MSAVRLIPDPSRAWEQIQGQNHHQHMAAGYTPSASSPTSGRLDVEEMLNRPHDAYKVISLNNDQENLLSRDIPSVAFLNDFGAGKNIAENQRLNRGCYLSP